MLTFPIFFLLKWKNCFHYCKSTHLSWFGSHFLSRALVLPSSPLSPELSTFPSPLDCSHQHTRILLYFLTLCLPMLPPCFYIHCLHFFISLSHSKGSSVSSTSLLLLFSRSPRLASMMSVVMVTCRTHFIQPLGNSQNFRLSWVSPSFWDAFFLLVPVTTHSPDWLLLLRLLINIL